MSSSIRRQVIGVKSAGFASFARVRKAFNLGPIETQRDHSKRATKVKHIGKSLGGNQMVFHMVIWKGVERLIDGYTRVERIIRALTEEPVSVVIIVYEEVFTKDELKALYDQIDSSTATKKAACRFDEGLRLTEMLNAYTTTLVTRGQKSAPQLAVGADTIRDGVENCKLGMGFVDSLGLDKTHETVGMLAAYYAIGQFASVAEDAAEEFIRKVNQRVFSPKKAQDKEVHLIVYRAYHAKKVEAGSATGGSGSKAILERGLAAFVKFLGHGDYLNGAAEQVTLAKFKELMLKLGLTKVA